ASAESPADNPSRILSAVWWIAVIVLMNAFTGHMRACMMIKSQTDTIDSLAELVAKTQVKPYIWGGTAYVFMLRDTGTPEYQAVWRNVERHRSMLPTEKLYSRSILAEVMAGGAVIVSDRSSLVYKVPHSTCERFANRVFWASQDAVDSVTLCYVMLRVRDLRTGYDHELLALVEGGFAQRWWEQGVGTWRDCGGARSSHEGGKDDVATSHSSLRFQDLRAVFVLWLCCASIATTVFVLECLVGAASRGPALCRGGLRRMRPRRKRLGPLDL
ncbi:unnamed protein product, partial [Ixodes hexagonus]